MSQPTHGARSSYNDGCRCQQCREAHAAYQRKRRRYGWTNDVAAAWTDPAPVREHIERLRSAGMGRRRIAELANVNISALDHLLYGKHGYKATRILRRNADAILAVPPNPAHGATIDATGTRRRIRALQAMGWPLREIAARMGWGVGNLGSVVSARRGVTRATADLVASVYNELSMKPGPSGKSRRLAARHGWAPPLAWDDDAIDDPHAAPKGSTHASGGA